MRTVRGKHFGSTVITVLLVLGWAELASSKRSGRATLAYADAFSGRVVGIIDGDTLTVLRERAPEHNEFGGPKRAPCAHYARDPERPVEVRLAGIDAPEHRQPFGTRAKQYAAELAFGQQ